MADKKITVLGDTADESLTPEEEHKIEVKIDEMLAVDKPAASPPADITEPDEASAPKIEKRKSKILVIDDSEDKSMDELKDLAAKTAEQASTPAPAAATAEASTDTLTDAKTAPPLPKKGSKKKIEPMTAEEPSAPDKAEESASADDAELSIEPAEAAADVPEPTPVRTPLKITITDSTVSPDAPDMAEESEPALDSVPEAPEPAAQEEAEDMPIAQAAEPSAQAEAPAVKSAPTIEPASAAKKYRPPDGPLPFKRAQPEPPAEIIDDLPGGLTPPLSAEDAEIAKAFEVQPHTRREAKAPGRRLMGWLIVLIIVAALAAVAAVPALRARALNLAHVQGSLQVEVLDAATHLPLHGATVEAGSKGVTTDQQGKADLSGLKLGSQQVVIKMAGYAAATRSTMLAWKSASLGTVSLQETGVKYSFVVTSYLTGKPLAGVGAVSGIAQATGDSQGKITLLVDKSATEEKVHIGLPGYRQVITSLPADPSKPVVIQLVPDLDDIYVAKTAGKFNVYRTGIDGSDQKLLLAGTGNETSEMSVVVNDSGRVAAIVATRDNQRDKAGYLLDTLALVSTLDGSTTTVAHAQQIRILGWAGLNSLVYTALKADTATNDPARQQILVYDTVSKKTTEVDHANSFNDVALVEGSLYYASSNHFSGGTSGLYKYDLAKKTKQTLLSSEVTDIIRSDYNDLLFMTSGSTYTYKLGGTTKPVATTATTNGSGRLYVASPDGKHSVWVDKASHKLMLYTKATGSETTLATQADMAYPVRWLNNSVILFRTSTPNFAADYAIDLTGGNAEKVTTVVDTAGLALWQD